MRDLVFGEPGSIGLAARHVALFQLDREDFEEPSSNGEAFVLQRDANMQRIDAIDAFFAGEQQLEVVGSCRCEFPRAF